MDTATHRPIPGRGAEAEAVRVLHPRSAAAQGAYALRGGREADRRCQPHDARAGRRSTGSSSTPTSRIPTVTLADGTTRRLDASTFAVSRTLPNREDRKKVFEAFFGALGQYRNTLGATMNANLQTDIFSIRARNYGIDARIRARLEQHPAVGLLQPGRRREREPPHVPSLSQASQTDDGTGRAPLLRSLCAARFQRGPHLLRGRSAQEHRHRAGPARHRLHLGDRQAPSRSAGSISIRHRESAPAPTRTAARTTSTRTC